MAMRAVKRVLVVGAGLMGAGIAQVAASSGFQVDLVDTQQGALDQGRERIVSSLNRLERAGKLRDGADAALARIRFGLDLERAARAADLVVEAIVEALEPKQSLFAKLGGWCPEDVILATNTSQFRIGQIAEPCKNPERVIGMHWSNPPPLMMLVEVIVSPATRDDVLEATLEACHLRFRPIIMTSLAFILGVLPLVVATGAGSSSQRAIGTGVMSGMIAATLLAVFFVPVFFVVVRRFFPAKPPRAADVEAVDE